MLCGGACGGVKSGRVLRVLPAVLHCPPPPRGTSLPPHPPSQLDSAWCEGYAWIACDARHIYLAQRFVERGDLERWLLATPQRRFEEGVARFYAAQVVLALRTLHAAGVIHRDLKVGGG